MLNVFLSTEAKNVAKEDEATETLELEFRPAKAWRTKEGHTITENGVPRDIDDLGTLWSGIRAAFAAIGAELIEPKPTYNAYMYCVRCESIFKWERSTARFCEDCARPTPDGKSNRGTRRKTGNGRGRV